MARRLLFTAISLFYSTMASVAASLQVQPAMVEVAAPGAASTITLHNAGSAPINVQVRVFKWSQSNGEETLEPTEEVAASPPAVTLSPGVDYVARIVRVTKRPISGEETYRLLVDELPEASQAATTGVRLLVRHSIPVFFAAADRTAPEIDWRVSKHNETVVLSAQNTGDAHLRISAVTLRDRAGKTVSFGNGLVGYALGHSTMHWTAPRAAHGFAASGEVAVSGQSNSGAFHATATAGASP